MTIDASPVVLLAILAMTGATYLTRAGGFWLMGYVNLTPRVRRMLEASPGAVIVATVLPLVVRDGIAAAAAVATGAVVMYLLRRDYLAVFAGMAVAAAARAMAG
ncbi:MAG TPA: AzlD domain-containing protein [Xanthobacteraceae bacterium]|nr:AzlD domain-containing protein [Xanthobacteraceae bacterium]